ncbi:MAG TPA: signal peptidase I [Collinsella ihuae]|uniref:Signal peptidase I n=1 Tax=Collinsella ihumii TaxID=1720204 RepID=A0A921IPZ2_9ACTN|nr:signal peptidase I [Collinsella ihumii]
MTPHANSTVRDIIEWVVVFAIALAAWMLVRTFVIEPYMVPTGSMENTIEIGDQVFAQKVTTELGQMPQPGEIIVFSNPDSSSEHDILVKRVIATAGQTVDLIEGRVYVDGQQLDEPYTQGSSYPLASQAEGVQLSYPYTVPDGCVWVMGDNRENSADSRYFGPVEQSEVIGVVVFRYWPLNRIGTL